MRDTEANAKQDQHCQSSATPPESTWAPPRAWTSWPLPKNEVPADAFMPQRPMDEDSGFTYFKREKVYPRTHLVDELSGTILGFARQRWNAMEKPADEEEKKSPEPTGDGRTDEESEETNRGASEELGSSSGVPQSPGMDVDEAPLSYDELTSHYGSDGMEFSTAASEPFQNKNRKRNREGEPETEYRPVFSADDEQSYELVRPAVSSIVGQLERTLTALSNARVTRIARRRTNSGSGTEEPTGSDADGEEDLPSRGRKKLRGKRSYFRNQAFASGSEDGDDSKKSAEDSAPKPTPTPNSQQKPKSTARQQSRSRSRSRRPRSRTPAPGNFQDSRRRSASTLRSRRFRIQGLGQRSWKEVLAAAALSGGFSDEVLQRTAQRCADLFGEGIEFASTSDYARIGIAKHAIVPHGDSSKIIDEIKMEEEEMGRWAGRSRSRSVVSARSRSRSRSGVPVTKRWFCPHGGCDWSEKPFPRRGNAERHVESIHGGDMMDMIVEEKDTVESGSELERGVHLDGFLRPRKKGRRRRGKEIDRGVKSEGRVERRGRPRKVKAEAQESR